MSTLLDNGRERMRLFNEAIFNHIEDWSRFAGEMLSTIIVNRDHGNLTCPDDAAFQVFLDKWKARLEELKNPGVNSPPAPAAPGGEQRNPRASLPPCDHDECGPTRCKLESSPPAGGGAREWDIWTKGLVIDNLSSCRTDEEREGYGWRKIRVREVLPTPPPAATPRTAGRQSPRTKRLRALQRNQGRSTLVALGEMELHAEVLEHELAELERESAEHAEAAQKYASKLQTLSDIICGGHTVARFSSVKERLEDKLRELETLKSESAGLREALQSIRTRAEQLKRGTLVNHHLVNYTEIERRATEALENKSALAGGEEAGE